MTDHPEKTPDTRPPHVRQADMKLSAAERNAAHLECWECNCHGFEDGIDWCQHVGRPSSWTLVDPTGCA